ncbi:uncharacterized protein [Drosophila bipectinata]|uniref:uncharacterized protein n=1 Tax=Drosophila bipectinata TaxID=42026 RepID=UPI001C8AFB04|nr:uncharacterized protein LOC108129365 [Drosophila bipectinata]
MGKRFKSKSLQNQKKEVLTVIKEEPEKCGDVNESKPVEEQAILKAVSSDDSEDSKKHLEQMESIKNMPLRLDGQIETFKSVQEELRELQKRQVTLLDECIETLQELNSAKPLNVTEHKLILNTFIIVKDKISKIFENCSPSQLDVLKQQNLILNASQEIEEK